MIIGTVRPEEARAYDSHEGYHQFHAAEDGTLYGSFEVFWDGPDTLNGSEPRNYDSEGEPVAPGWYWWPCHAGCLPDGDPMGPFARSSDAFYDADEHHPDNED